MYMYVYIHISAADVPAKALRLTCAPSRKYPCRGFGFSSETQYAKRSAFNDTTYCAERCNCLPLAPESRWVSPTRRQMLSHAHNPSIVRIGEVEHMLQQQLIKKRERIRRQGEAPLLGRDAQRGVLKATTLDEERTRVGRQDLDGSRRCSGGLDMPAAGKRI